MVCLSGASFPQKASAKLASCDHATVFFWLCGLARVRGSTPWGCAWCQLGLISLKHGLSISVSSNGLSCSQFCRSTTDPAYQRVPPTHHLVSGILWRSKTASEQHLSRCSGAPLRRRRAWVGAWASERKKTFTLQMDTHRVFSPQTSAQTMHALWTKSHVASFGFVSTVPSLKGVHGWQLGHPCIKCRLVL